MTAIPSERLTTGGPMIRDHGALLKLGLPQPHATVGMDYSTHDVTGSCRHVRGSARILLQLCTTLGVLALAVNAIAVATFPRGLNADMTLHFVCAAKPIANLEERIEQYLDGHGFRVLNLGRIQRKHGVGPGYLHVIGVDDKPRIIDVIALVHAPGRFALTLNTPPPTERAVDLEQSIQDFVVNRLGCELQQVNRAENPREVMDLFEREIQRIERLFREGEALGGRRRADSGTTASAT